MTKESYDKLMINLRSLFCCHKL